MKRIFQHAILILFFFVLIGHPAVTLAGARDGLLLWFNTVLPTLLPFMILSNLMLGTGSAKALARIAACPLRKCMGISDYGAYAMLVGFLCGYPMGSKVITDLVTGGKISSSEGSYLLSFCNNPSPVFLVSYLVHGYFKTERLLLPTLLLLYGVPLILSVLFRAVHIRSMFSYNDPPAPGIGASGVPVRSGIDDCIMDGITGILKIGGYIIIFSILIKFAIKLPFNWNWWKIILLPSLELTSGISFLAHRMHSLTDTYVLCIFHTAFGGWCATMQTSGIIRRAGLSTGLYIIEKLITALVTSLIAYLYIHYLF